MWYEFALNCLSARDAARIAGCNIGTAVRELKRVEREIKRGVDLRNLRDDRALEAISKYLQSNFPLPATERRSKPNLESVFAYGRA